MLIESNVCEVDYFIQRSLRFCECENPKASSFLLSLRGIPFRQIYGSWAFTSFISDCDFCVGIPYKWNDIESFSSLDDIYTSAVVFQKAEEVIVIIGQYMCLVQFVTHVALATLAKPCAFTEQFDFEKQCDNVYRVFANVINDPTAIIKVDNYYIQNISPTPRQLIGYKCISIPNDAYVIVSRKEAFLKTLPEDIINFIRLHLGSEPQEYNSTSNISSYLRSGKENEEHRTTLCRILQNQTFLDLFMQLNNHVYLMARKVIISTKENEGIVIYDANANFQLLRYVVNIIHALPP